MSRREVPVIPFIPEGAISLVELVNRTGGLNATIAAKIRSKQIASIGKVKYKTVHTLVFNITDVQFILDFDFSNYVPSKERFNKRPDSHKGLYLTMAQQVIKVGLR